MSWWEGIILIIVYFSTMWISRLVFFILMAKVISRLISDMQDKIQGNIESFKNSFSKGDNEEDAGM